MNWNNMSLLQGCKIIHVIINIATPWRYLMYLMYHWAKKHDVRLIEQIQDKFSLVGNKVKYAYVTESKDIVLRAENKRRRSL
jgi:hypothetical protein